MNKGLRIFMLTSLAIVMAVVVPSSFSKYVNVHDYDIEITSNVQFEKYTYSDVSGNNKTITADNTGYYVVLAKGGSGGCGISGQDSSWNVRTGTQGNGGIVLSYMYLTKDTEFVVSVGSKGGNAAKASPGTPGKNKCGFGLGSIGSQGDGQYDNASSGGSGASTVVFSSTTVNVNNVIIVAGGGGSSSGTDTYYKSGGYPGNGGSAGSNVGTESLTSVAFPVPGSVFDGVDGYIPGEPVKRTYTGGTWYYPETCTIDPAQNGGGGTTSGGAAGSKISVYGSDNYGGSVGTTFSSSSRGLGANSTKSWGGSGGGGYCGGGSGGGGMLGITNTVSVGGGGGGSSYIADSVNPMKAANVSASYSSNEYLNKLSTYMLNKATYTANDLDGFVIVMYLGKSLA